MYSACHLLKDAFIILLFFIYLKDNTYMYMYRHSDICKCHKLTAMQVMSRATFFLIIQYIIISIYPERRNTN